MMVEGRGGAVDTDAGYALLREASTRGHLMAERTLLNIEDDNARSIPERLAIKRKIISLAKRGAEEILKDPRSDNLR